MRRPISLVLVLALGVSVAGAEENLSVAREHYRRATTLYDLRRYKEAAREYEQAFESKDDPALLFNIGQAYRLANEPAAAIASYRAYLRRMPEAPNRIEVEVFLEELQKQLDQQKRAQEAMPVGPQTPNPQLDGKGEPPRGEAAAAARPAMPPADTGRGKRIAGITLGAAGVALIVTGAVFGGLAQSLSNQFTTPANPNQDRFDPTQDALGHTYFGVEVAGLVVGGAALVSGMTLFLVGRKEPQRVAVTPALGPRHAGLSLDVRF